MTPASKRKWTLVALLVASVAVPAALGWRPIGIWWALTWLVAAFGGARILALQASESVQAGGVTAGLVSGYAAVRMAVVTALVALVCGLGGALARDATVAIDIIGLLGMVGVVLYFLVGTPLVVQNIERIAEQDRRVDAVRAEHRTEGRIVFSAGARLGTIRVPSGAGGGMAIDRLQRRARTIEHALVHSHGGGVGSLEGHQSGGMPRLDVAVLRPLVAELDSAVEALAARSSDPEAVTRVDAALARIERELAVAEMF